MRQEVAYLAQLAHPKWEVQGKHWREWTLDMCYERQAAKVGCWALTQALSWQMGLQKQKVAPSKVVQAAAVPPLQTMMSLIPERLVDRILLLVVVGLHGGVELPDWC